MSMTGTGDARLFLKARSLRESCLGVKGSRGMHGIESVRNFVGKGLWHGEILVLRCSDDNKLGKHLQLFALHALVSIITPPP